MLKKGGNLCLCCLGHNLSRLKPGGIAIEHKLGRTTLLWGQDKGSLNISATLVWNILPSTAPPKKKESLYWIVKLERKNGMTETPVYTPHSRIPDHLVTISYQNTENPTGQGLSGQDAYDITHEVNHGCRRSRTVPNT